MRIEAVSLLFLPILPVFCAPPENLVTDQLERVYARYSVVGAVLPAARIGRLVELDQDIRKLIDVPWTIANRSLDKKYWKEKYQTIGVGVGHYSESLEYSGKLLADARVLDSALAHGAHTRYAGICGGLGSFTGPCQMPNLEAALSYAKAFPKGPFIEDTLITLGNFYDDLYKALQEPKQGYKYECFAKYMASERVAEQREVARTTAIRYYASVLALGSVNRASNQAIKNWKGGLESKESFGWHFCAD